MPTRTPCPRTPLKDALTRRVAGRTDSRLVYSREVTGAQPRIQPRGKLNYLELHRGFPRFRTFRCENYLPRVYLWPTDYQLDVLSQVLRGLEPSAPGHLDPPEHDVEAAVSDDLQPTALIGRPELVGFLRRCKSS